SPLTRNMVARQPMAASNGKACSYTPRKPSSKVSRNVLSGSTAVPSSQATNSSTEQGCIPRCCNAFIWKANRPAVNPYLLSHLFAALPTRWYISTVTRPAPSARRAFIAARSLATIDRFDQPTIQSGGEQAGQDVFGVAQAPVATAHRLAEQAL